MLGWLLARSGVDVLVLEKHEDFLRDFRGDTIHPSTLELMHELGVLGEFLERPHQKLYEIRAQVGNRTVTLGDFSHLPTHCKYLVLMPQWEFLDFAVQQAQKHSGFRIMMRAEVTDVIAENGVIGGLHVKTPNGPLEVLAPLSVGADGRRSVVRERAGLEVQNLGAPIDVMWMRISRRATDPEQTFGHAEPGKMMVVINREEYWQCAFVIPKGAADEIRQRGLESFRREIAAMQPFLQDRVEELQDWNQVSLLTVAVDRLVHWCRPGVLCIGDAAHAMSPIGGVGINLAIQDAVAAANILGPKLQQGAPALRDLQAVQERRTFPTVATQRLQVAIQNRIIRRVLEKRKQLELPWVLRLFGIVPALRRLPARIIGVGFRPEHVAVQPVRAETVQAA